MVDSELHVRSFLKILRDPTKTAYDELPSGKTLGEVANEMAVAKYTRKVELKRERARETRARNKKDEKPTKKSKILSCKNSDALLD
jgi:hypothetical protein